MRLQATNRCTPSSSASAAGTGRGMRSSMTTLVAKTWWPAASGQAGTATASESCSRELSAPGELETALFRSQKQVLNELWSPKMRLFQLDFWDLHGWQVNRCIQANLGDHHGTLTPHLTGTSQVAYRLEYTRLRFVVLYTPHAFHECQSTCKEEKEK